MDISHLKSLGESAKEVSKFLFVAQYVYVHKVGAALRETAVVLGDRLSVAPVAPGDAPLVADTLSERLFAARGQLRLCRSAKPASECPP